MTTWGASSTQVRRPSSPTSGEPLPSPRPPFLRAANAHPRVAAAQGGQGTGRAQTPSCGAAPSKEACDHRPRSRLSPKAAGVVSARPPGPCHFSRGRRSQEVWKQSEPGCGESRGDAGGVKLLLWSSGEGGVGWGNDRNFVTYFILEPPSA